MARIERQERRANTRHYNTKETSPTGPVPSISGDLLEYLDRTFPGELPPEGTERDELCALWGTRRVVDHLREVYRQQQEQQEDLPDVLRLQSQSTSASYAAPGTTSAAR